MNTMAEDVVATMTAPTGESAPATPATDPAPSGGVQEQPPQEQQTETGKVEEPKVEKPDYRKRYQEGDPDLKALIDQEADRLTQKRMAADIKKRERERVAKAAEDPVEALAYTQDRKRELDAEGEAEQRTSAAYTKAHADLADLWKDKEWAKEYEALRTGPEAKEFNERYAKDPEGFVDWVDGKITQSSIERRAKAMATEMVKAMKLDLENAALRDTPRLPMGNAAADQALLDRFSRMDPAERTAYYREHKSQIEAAEQRRMEQLVGR